MLDPGSDAHDKSNRGVASFPDMIAKRIEMGEETVDLQTRPTSIGFGQDRRSDRHLNNNCGSNHT